MAARVSTAEGGDGERGVGGDAEMRGLEEEMLEAQSTLVGELQQIESLAREKNKKVEELNDLEEDVKAVQERNEYDLSMLHDEHTCVQQELTHRRAVLQEQLAQLTLKHGRYQVVAALSNKAAADVESILAGMERRTKAHAEEVHATRQEVLHLRQALENTFRKTLKDLEGTYRRKAFQALGSKDKAGMRANKILREEMALQDVGLAALSQRHVGQSERALSLRDDLRKLSMKARRREDELAAALREGRTAGSYVADMQETKARIIAEDKSLRQKLKEEGVPPKSPRSLRRMIEEEENEVRKLDDMKHMWQRRIKDLIRVILPSASESQQYLLQNFTSSGGSGCSTSHKIHGIFGDSRVSGSTGSATGSGSLMESGSSPGGSGGSFPAQHDGSTGHGEIQSEDSIEKSPSRGWVWFSTNDIIT